MVPFSTVWRRIETHAGAVFSQIRGGEFRYTIKSGCVFLDRTNRQIPRSNFESAFKLVPLKNTVPLQRFQGPSYIYAILMDGRIRSRDW